MLKEYSYWEQLIGFDYWTKNITATFLSNENVQNLLKSSNEYFDLVIVETLQIEAMYAFAAHFKAPLVGFSSFGTDRIIDTLVNNISPPSYITTPTMILPENMNFWQRLRNLLHACIEMLYYNFVHLPAQESLYHKYFAHLKQNFHEIINNFSIVLLNQHFSLGQARPYVPNMIEVGGLHLPAKNKALPEDMREFIENAKHGVIYFSMGSNIKSKDFPAQHINVIMQTFASLPQRVMWKFENSNLPNKPKNVYISSWFPQADILAHPNVKLFISHGGLLSTMEAIYYGKPILGMPIFYDQHANVWKAVNAGYGLHINYKTLNIQEFTAKIQEILRNSSYTQVAQKKSLLYCDQPEKPLHKAIWWIEYVLRHSGANHMQVAAKNLNFWQKHSIDTSFVLLVVSSLIVFIMLSIIKKIICKAFSLFKLAKTKTD